MFFCSPKCISERSKVSPNMTDLCNNKLLLINCSPTIANSIPIKQNFASFKPLLSNSLLSHFTRRRTAATRPQRTAVGTKRLAQAVARGRYARTRCTCPPFEQEKKARVRKPHTRHLRPRTRAPCSLWALVRIGRSKRL